MVGTSSYCCLGVTDLLTSLMLLGCGDVDGLVVVELILYMLLARCCSGVWSSPVMQR